MHSIYSLAARMTVGLVALGLLASCSTSYVMIDDTHASPELQGAPYRKIMVLCVASPHHFRESFENIFADSLRRHGVAGVPSFKHVSDLNDAHHERLDQLARQHGADAVVITRVVSKSEHTGYNLATGHAEYRVVSKTVTRGGTTTTIAMSGAGYVPGEVDQVGTYLLTNLFDASSARLLWSAKSHAAGLSDDTLEIDWKLSFALVKALAADGLIEVTAKSVKIPSL